MSGICRIYLDSPTGLRSFYWVELEDDSSIYFGSSVASKFTYGYGATSTISLEGSHIVPERDGRPLSLPELRRKTSFHGSGVVNLKSETGDSGGRIQIVELRKGFIAIPLVALLPMHPGRYPVSAKKLKSSDICIPSDMHQSYSFGLLLYVCAVDAAEPLPIAVAKARLPFFSEFSRQLDHLEFCIFAYACPQVLSNWPNEQIQMIGHPEFPGGEPNWPFFA